MRYLYERATDSLAIAFADGRRYRDSQEIYDGIVIDYDTAGRPIAIEFSDRASRYVDTEGLADGRWVEIIHPALKAPPTKSITGAELRARRQQLGITQDQLALQLETTKNTIARWERNEVKIEHGEMLRLALEALTPVARKTSAGKSIFAADQTKRGIRSPMTSASHPKLGMPERGTARAKHASRASKKR